MPADTLGLRIKRARERLRWTQRQLADAIGVTQKTIDSWEHDRRRPKSAIGALEHVLGADLEGNGGQQLPDDITRHRDDPLVSKLLADDRIPQDAAIGLIRIYLARLRDLESGSALLAARAG